MPNRNRSCIHQFVCSIRKVRMYLLGRLWRARSPWIIKSRIIAISLIITCMGIRLDKMIMKRKKSIRWLGVINSNKKEKDISLVITIRIVLRTTLELIIIINIAIRYRRYASKKRCHNLHSLISKRLKWTIIIIIFQVK